MITQVVQFTENVKKNGDALELRVRKYLDSMAIPFKFKPKNGIDFVINGEFHMDAVAQGVSGTIGDKLPTKCFKYIRRYKLHNKDIYILHPYSPIHRVVGEHLELLEREFNCSIHILDWKDFTFLMNGGEFSKRNPYKYGKKSKSIRNCPPTNKNINKFFTIQN